LIRASALALALALLSSARSGSAEEQQPQLVLREAMAAIQRGAFDQGVGQLELLADRGFVHPDASYARAYAYVERARSRARHDGDLGRAVAALEEARLLRPNDASTEDALAALRAEISRRRARGGSSPVLQRPTLARAVTSLFSENTWAIIAAVGSSLLTAGLALYLFVKRRTAEIAGAVAMAAGLVLGLIAGSLAISARNYRRTTSPAVVVVAEARLLDATGRPRTVVRGEAGSVPEGALLYVRETRDGRARVEWGSVDAWLDASQVRQLATEVTPGRW
jgi:hypothetical protein